MNVRLVMIDDSDIDLKLKKAYFEEALKPFDVSIDTFTAPLATYGDYEAYDGIIMDYDLGGTLKGLEVCRQIHAHLPEMMMVLHTGMVNWFPEFAGVQLCGISHVLDKNRDDKAAWVLYDFVRVIVRIKTALGRRSSVQRLGAEFRQADKMMTS